MSTLHLCSIVPRDGVYFVDCSVCAAVAGFHSPDAADAFARSHEDSTYSALHMERLRARRVAQRSGG